MMVPHNVLKCFSLSCHIILHNTIPYDVLFLKGQGKNILLTSLFSFSSNIFCPIQDKFLDKNLTCTLCTGVHLLIVRCFTSFQNYLLTSLQLVHLSQLSSNLLSLLCTRLFESERLLSYIAIIKTIISGE